MNDIEHPPGYVILDRSVTVGASTYRVAATDTGDGCIDVTVLSVGPDGRVAAEIGGGFPRAELSVVADLLTSTMDALTALHRTPGRSPGRPAGPSSPRYPNQGGRWTREDDERLLARHREGATDRELMGEFGRSRGGIRLRLERLGAIASAVA